MYSITILILWNMLHVLLECIHAYQSNSKYGESYNIARNHDNHSSFIPFITMSSSFCILYSIVCPDEESLFPITLWTIMSKVRIEACMWVSPAE